MGIIIGSLIGLFVFVTSLILPWVNRDQISDLRDKMQELRAELLRLHALIEKAQPYAQAPLQVEPPSVLGAAYRQPEPPPVVTITTKAPMEEKPAPVHAAREETARVSFIQPAQTKAAGSLSFEQQFGGRIFVWLGGIALALAGVFLVKYSIESGLLTEKVRIALGLAFGVSLLYGSHLLRARPRIADSARISQALAGAGIADLYGCFFAATTLYHLVPSWFGFSCMAGVTGVALVMSLRYGAPIAMLGLIGGYVTPMLIHGEPHTVMLFGYLYLVFVSLAVVIRRQEWWWMSIPATLIAYAWVVMWLFTGDNIADGPCLSLFLLAISATVVALTRGTEDDNPASLQSWFRYLSTGGALILMAAVTETAHFNTTEWDMFGLFSVSAIILAWFDNRTYGFTPWLAMGANVVMLLAWNSADPTAVTITTVAFGLLFTIGGYALMSRSANAISGAGLSVTSAVIYYLIAYHRLDGDLVALQMDSAFSAADIWASLAFAFTAVHTATVSRFSITQRDTKQRQALQAIFASGAIGFLSLGFLILLHQEFLAFAIAAQILTVSWVNTKTDIPALRPIAMVLTALFGILMVPEMTDLIASPFDDFRNSGSAWFHGLHTPSSLLFRLGLPAVMFAGSSWLMRQQRDNRFTAILEITALALFTAMAYDGTNMALPGAENAFIARGIFTNILLALSLGMLRVGHQHTRKPIEWSGLILGGFAVARIIGFDLMLDNPLWSHTMIGTLPPVNALALAYGLPILLLLAIGNEGMVMGRTELATANKIFAYILAFIFVSMNVRQFYHGTYLDTGFVSNAEVYSYSAAWLAFGIALLFGGTLRQDRMMRIASLLIMMLTVGKVFLYDASELTGLWRVISFLGLGLSLLGLSWFYSRFVFAAKNRKPVLNE